MVPPFFTYRMEHMPMYVLHVFTVGYYVTSDEAEAFRLADQLGLQAIPIESAVMHSHWLRSERGNNCGTIAKAITHTLTHIPPVPNASSLLTSPRRKR